MIVDSNEMVCRPISASKARELMNKEYVPTKNDVVILSRLMHEINEKIKEYASGGQEHIPYCIDCIYAETVDISGQAVEYIADSVREMLIGEGYLVSTIKCPELRSYKGKVFGFTVRFDISWEEVR